MNGAVMKNFITDDTPFASSVVGAGDIFVSEVDESDGSIAQYSPKIAVLNNVALELRRGEVLALVGENGAGKSSLMKILGGIHAADEGEVVLERTPFYAESGGQVGDTGELVTGSARFKVSDTRKRGAAFSHIGKLTGSGLAVGASVEARIDNARRDHIRRNHTATHLLHAALREVLGTHVQQKGSLVAPERLRYCAGCSIPPDSRGSAGSSLPSCARRSESRSLGTWQFSRIRSCTSLCSSPPR